MGFGPFFVWRTVRNMQKEVYVCETHATWNEVGLYLGWTWSCG